VRLPTTYDIDSRHVAKLAGEIERLLDSKRTNFSQGAAALLLALMTALGTIEQVAQAVPEYRRLYQKMPFSRLQQAAIESLAVLDEYLRHSATELKQ
jgi:hypothetical protein